MALRPLLLAVLMAATACSGGDGGDDGADLGTTSTIGAPSAPVVPPASPEGTGVVVIGERGTGSSFAVTSCALEPAGDAAPTAELLRVTGEGTTGKGIPFEVEIVRTSTSAAADTFTDLITYADTARILQVQRSESAGEVTDLRDPAARGTLLRTREGGLSAVGIAGPPGTDVEGPGLVGLALDVSC
jgi:hypothetical protein